MDTHAYTYICIRMHTHTYGYACIHIHMHTHAYTYIWIRMHTHTYGYILWLSSTSLPGHACPLSLHQLLFTFMLAVACLSVWCVVCCWVSRNFTMYMRSYYNTLGVVAAGVVVWVVVCSTTPFPAAKLPKPLTPFSASPTVWSTLYYCWDVLWAVFGFD